MSDQSQRFRAGAFVAELRRRNVFRAAAIYVAAVWALAQGIAQLAPAFGGSNWWTRWFVIACAAGFPFWIAFAWHFEWTPRGPRRDRGDGVAVSGGRRTRRRLDWWIFGTMAVAIVLLATNQFVRRQDATSRADARDTSAIAKQFAAIPPKSVAVLPLVNASGDPKQRYFSDGLSEELISDLTQVSDLKVIGKYSSFKFRDSEESPAAIGAALGVAHLIRGSVRQQGDRIRVTVNLINASDGRNVWSQAYDEQLKDVFAIQSRIGRAVADALKVKLLGAAIVSTDKPPGGSVEAYQLMLQGHDLVQRYTEDGFREGIALLHRALGLDPDYAYAWGVLSTALVNRGQIFLTGDARAQAYADARSAAGRQLLLAPDAADTHLNRGYLLANLDKDPVAALAAYRRALELAPNDGRAMSFMAYGLANVGQLQEAAEWFRKAIATDPLHTSWYAGLSSFLMGDRRLDAAEQASRKTLELQPDFPGMRANLAMIGILRGDTAGAERAAVQEADPVLGPWIRAMAQQVDPDQRKADAALQGYLADHGKDEPYFVADLYAARRQPDLMFKWLERARVQQDPNFASVLYDPFPLTYAHDPRFAALCGRAGLPIPGRPLPGAADSAMP